MLQPFRHRVVVVEHEVGGSPDVRADVALFDTFAARRDALTRAKKMLDESVVDHVVLYTWDAPEEFLAQAEAIGVDAVITKSTSAAELVRSLERVVAGEKVGLETVVKGERSRHNGAELTVREQEVLALLALGLSNAEIAHELFLSVDTIKTHVRRVFTKLGVNNRTQAAMRAVDPSGGLGRAGAGRHGGLICRRGLDRGFDEARRRHAERGRRPEVRAGDLRRRRPTCGDRRSGPRRE